MGRRSILSMIVVAALAAPTLAATPEESALEHYDRATKLYNLTRYDEAIAEYEKAYEAKADPRFLYNIGQAERLAGHPDKAVRFYRNYLRLDPASPLKDALEVRIRELEQAVALQQPSTSPGGTLPPTGPKAEAAPAPTTTPPPPPRPDLTYHPPSQPAPIAPAPPLPVTRKAWFWGVVGGAAALVIAAIVVGVVAGGAHDPTPSQGVISFGGM